MSESPPLAKRARLFQEHSPSASPVAPPPLSLTAFKHHEEFWFEDGNLILLARQIAFRLYSGLLAAQSTVFADRLASARSDPTQRVEGCLVLEVHDTPEELAHLLRVILPKTRPVFRKRMATGPRMTFDHVAAVVRLAHKYKLEDVRVQGIALLQEGHYPLDYMAWTHRDIHPTIRMQKENAIGAVNLARSTGAIALLPMAIYGCVRLGSAVLDGWKRDDGEVEYLVPEDLKCCMNMRDVLARKGAVAFARAFKVTTCRECSTPNQCRSGMRTARRDVFVEYFAGHLILDDWDMDFELLMDDYGVCRGCSCEVLFRDLNERNEVWDRLPEILGIEVEGWGVEPSYPL